MLGRVSNTRLISHGDCSNSARHFGIDEKKILEDGKLSQIFSIKTLMMDFPKRSSHLVLAGDHYYETFAGASLSISYNEKATI